MRAELTALDRTIGIHVRCDNSRTQQVHENALSVDCRRRGYPFASRSLVDGRCVASEVYTVNRLGVAKTKWGVEKNIRVSFAHHS